MHERFGFDTKRIGDAIDVIEVTNHLRRIVDDLVIRTGGSEDIEVGRSHDMRRLGQLFGVLEQSTIELADAGLAPIGADVVDK